MNLTYDFIQGQFLILMIDKDGPSRVDGPNTYSSIDRAERAIKSKLSDSHPNSQFLIVEVHHRYWRDQTVRVLSNKATE